MAKALDKDCPYSDLLVALHKHEIYQEDHDMWECLLAYQAAVRDHYAKLYLDVHIDEEEGFAFLKSKDDGQGSQDGDDSPRLVKRMALSKHATLLAVLLREALYHFEFAQRDDLVLVLTRLQIREMMHPTYQITIDDAKFAETVDAAIKSACAVGFLKAFRNDEKNQDSHRFEVRRIIKARLSVQQMQTIKELFQENQTESQNIEEPQETVEGLI